MSKVSEFMNADVISVYPEDSLEKVIKIFNEKKINGLPVVNIDKKVVGIISARDLLKNSEKTEFAPLSFYHGWAPEFPFQLDATAYKKSVAEFLEIKVDEVMSKKVSTVNESNSWHEAATLMKKRSVNRLPVVDDEGHLKGIVTRNDLLDYLSKHEVLK